MESRWYLFPGQTVANTKISERAHALHITSKEWGNITKHLDRKKLIQEAIDKEEQKKKYLDEGSKSMIKNWENSLENIRKRKEEERLRLIEQKKDDRIQRFFKLREEQEKIRKEYVDKVKKQIFMTTGYARELTSSLITGEVLYEREKQKEFKKIIKKHDKEEEEKFAELVKENARKEVEEKKEAAKKEIEKKKKYGGYLKNVIEENAATNKDLKEKQFRKEAMDNILAVQEMENIKKNEEEQKMEKKRLMRIEKQKMLTANDEMKKQLAKEEKELDDVVAIYQEAKHSIDCLKKQREKELKDAVIARREETVKLMIAKVQEKADDEEKQIKAAIAERDEVEKAKTKARADLDERIRLERVEDRKQFMAREEAAQKKETELKKWEMLNRYKTDEVTKKYEEKRRKEAWKKILEYRQELLDQMKEEEEERIKEKEIQEFITRQNFVSEDDKFFSYADEVLEHAKKKGRPTYPIEKVIMQYKKINNLLLPNEESSNCEEYKGGGCKESASKQLIKKSEKTRNCKCTLPKK